jgi:hypothetical protein
MVLCWQPSITPSRSASNAFYPAEFQSASGARPKCFEPFIITRELPFAIKLHQEPSARRRGDAVFHRADSGSHVRKLM